nr:MAG TPA: hypothetical protein [Caudoviricetes sp.]
MYMVKKGIFALMCGDPFFYPLKSKRAENPSHLTMIK